MWHFLRPRRSSSPDGTAILTEEELDWLQSGVVFPRAPPPQKGRSPISVRQVKRRESRLLHKLHLHPREVRSARSSADTCKFSGVSGLLRSRPPRRPSVRKSSAARVGPLPFTRRVDVSGAAAVESPVQSSPDMNFLVERRFTRRMRKRTRPSESRCPVRHRRALPVLNMWHRPRKAVNRELHALNGNTSSSVPTPILPVQGFDPAGSTVRSRIRRKSSRHVHHA